MIKKTVFAMASFFLAASLWSQITFQDLNMEISRTTRFGYFIVIQDNPLYPYILFQTADTRQLVAIYLFDKGKWLRRDPGFDSDKINLTVFYKKLPDFLKVNTVKKQQSDQTENKLKTVPDYAHSETQVKKTTPEDVPKPVTPVIDPTGQIEPDEITERNPFEINRDLNGKMFDGCRVYYNVHGFHLTDPDDNRFSYAEYRVASRSWYLFRFPDRKVSDMDLQIFYPNLTREEADAYNRRNPADQNIYELNISSYYDDSDDPDFQEFMRYLNSRDTEDNYKDFYRKIATLPEMRERLQFHFDLRDPDNPYRKPMLEVFTRNRPVKLTVMQVYPLHPTEDLRKPLTRKELQEIKRDYESAFGTGFKVYSNKATISYRKLADIPEGVYPAIYQNEFLSQQVDYRASGDSLVLYYFMDHKRLLQFPRIKTSNPMGRGSGTANWKGSKWTAIHELGHSLSMQHHWDVRKAAADPFDVHNFNSPICIMNYLSYKSREFCPLCRYVMRLE